MSVRQTGHRAAMRSSAGTLGQLWGPEHETAHQERKALDQTPHVGTGTSHPRTRPQGLAGGVGQLNVTELSGPTLPGSVPSRISFTNVCLVQADCRVLSSRVFMLLPPRWVSSVSLPPGVGSRGQPLPRQVPRASCPAPQDAHNTELWPRL